MILSVCPFYSSFRVLPLHRFISSSMFRALKKMKVSMLILSLSPGPLLPSLTPSFMNEVCDGEWESAFYYKTLQHFWFIVLPYFHQYLVYAPTHTRHALIHKSMVQNKPNKMLNSQFSTNEFHFPCCSNCFTTHNLLLKIVIWHTPWFVSHERASRALEPIMYWLLCSLAARHLLKMSWPCCLLLHTGWRFHLCAERSRVPLIFNYLLRLLCNAHPAQHEL